VIRDLYIVALNPKELSLIRVSGRQMVRLAKHPA